jgi:hypothetical protein
VTLEFTDLDSPEFQALFEDIKESWFRLETLQVYAVDYERTGFNDFMRTGRLDRQPYGRYGRWQQMLRRHADAGRRIQRVHVIEEPLTDYLRYELAAYQFNAAAGEEIRLIAVSPKAWPTGVPRATDFWLFDDHEVWDMEYNDAGDFLCARRSTSEAYLEQCRQWRDAAMRQSIALEDYTRPAH